jgi:hypothetical protein
VSNKLELLMRKAARELRDQQVCVLYKIPEEMQQTPCDFIGYTASGRCIMIECKMVKRPSLPIGKAPGLAAHQWRALDEADRAGCICIVIWQRDDVLNFLMPGNIRDFMESGRKSVPWMDLVACADQTSEIIAIIRSASAASLRTT